MFTKYWRSYPWFLQLFLFAMMVFIFMSLGSLINASLIPLLTGIKQEVFGAPVPGSSATVLRASLFSVVVGGFLIFAAPCLLFAYLTTPRPAEYLGLRKPGRPIHWILAIGIMAGFILVAAYGEAFLSKFISLPLALGKDLKRDRDIQKAFLDLNAFGDQLLAFSAMSILPAFGEELMFRGIMLRFSKKRSPTMATPILISAAFFTMMHSVSIGLLFVFIGGILLAFIYWYTGSLLCAMAGHFAFNGIQVALELWGSDGVNEHTPMPIYLFFAGLVLSALCFYFLKKTKTPLPENWTDDFYPSELKTVEQA